MEVTWSPDGSYILVSGEPTLGMVTRDSWEITYSKDFGHKKAISCIVWLTDNVFATAGLDKVVKIWDYAKKSLLNFFISANEVLQVSYCQKVT